jgi:branched-chain amino acid transport system substrate-binding protein
VLKKRVLLVGLTVTVLVVALGLAGCGSGGGKAQTKTLVYANEAPFSGPYAAWGLMAQPSCEIAAEDVNAAGGIKVGNTTYMLKIQKYDNTMDPTVAATVTRKAIFDDGVKYLGMISTDEAGSVNELCNSQKVALFAMAPARKLIGPKHLYTLQTYYEIGEADEVMLHYLQKSNPNVKRIAVIAPDDTRGHIAGEDFKKMAPVEGGFTVVDTIYTGAEDTDFMSPLTNLLAKGVDMIDVSCSGPEVQGNVIKQARELGYKGMFMHPDTLDVPTVSEICGIQNLEGDIAASQYVTMPTPVGKKWADRYVKMYGSLQSWAAGYYDNIMLMKLAMEKAQSIEPEKILKALGEVSYEGTMGKSQFIGKNIPSVGSDSVLTIRMNVVQIQGGKEVDVFGGFGTFWKEKKETE